jgi:electron transport complex protein RnfB
MAQDVFQKLRSHLDNLPGGYPTTDSGVELRILRRLFAPEEARLATKLTVIPEPGAVVARRAKLPVGEATRLLDDMARKGLIFRYEYKGDVMYMAAQYVIGIWEYHVNDLDPELIKDMNEYIPHLFKPEVWKEAPQLRTIPVGRSITPEHEVMPYEAAEELVRGQKKILVAPCICRREHQMVGEGCDKPLESCLVFGAGVDYYEANGLGRRIDVEEAVAILKQADKKGLVLQPTNSKKIMNMCCCCGCCCQVLRTIKRYPKPADIVSSPFIAKAEPESCKGCGVCVERCQMEALSLDEDEKVVLDLDRCIGCGLCVSTCPTKSLTLERKPEADQPEVPRNSMEAMLNTARARGKLSSAKLAVMSLKSKVDRLLASS